MKSYSNSSTLCYIKPALLAITELIIIIIVILTPSSSNAYQIDYNNDSGEYCYNESFNLGTCLGKQKEEDENFSEAQLLRCTECSGSFNGDETCAELKALNDVAEMLPEEESTNATTNSNQINWHDSFCETYNICVEENCPKKCWHEQDAWIQCLIIELDCDWRCQHSDWAEMIGEGGRYSGMMFSNSGGAGFRQTIIGGILLLICGYVMH